MAVAASSLVCGQCDVRWPAWAVRKRQKQVARPAALVCPCCEGGVKADPRRPVEDSVAKHFLFEHFYANEWPELRDKQELAELEKLAAA